MLRFAGAAAVLLLGLAAQSRADFVTDTLGAAGPSNFSLLGLARSNDISISGANNQPPLPGGGMVGNVGIVNSAANFSLSSPASVTGNVYLA
ncbi:MAG TPA: hypothetical protein VMS17_07590, partial [Gemmataceae bacterium]|nr:hypothetical protein [Gemmataceae bacterium]